MSAFYVFRCKYWGQWGAKEISKSVLTETFKCVYCQKSCKIKTKKGYGLNLDHKGPWENPRASTAVCQALNNLRGEKNEKN